jgi:hypothetical protein
VDMNGIATCLFMRPGADTLISLNTRSKIIVHGIQMHIFMLSKATTSIRLMKLICKYLGKIIPPDNIHIYEPAVKTGRLDVMLLLREYGCPWNPLTFQCWAAGYGQLNIIKYLHDPNHLSHNEICESAALGGQKDIIEYLHENGYSWDASTFIGAVNANAWWLINYLYENGCPWGVQVCSAAALTGRIDMIKRLHELDCPWDESTSRDAVSSGSLNVIQYVISNGCPYNMDTLKQLARRDDVKKWFDEYLAEL